MSRSQPVTPPIEPKRSPFMRLAVSFTVAVVALTLLVLYYSLARAVIILEVKPDRAVMDTSLTVKNSAQGNEMTGIVYQLELSESKSFSASPSGELEDRATGTVTIVNHAKGSQSLIATTRLLSPTGVLYRIKQTVTVPVGGQVTVPVAADKVGEASVIGPTRFTIPGLPKALQELIYAESSEPMRRAEKPGNIVTAGDLEQARKTLSDKLIPQGISKLREQLPADKRAWAIAYKSEITKTDSSVPAGSKQAAFTATVTVRITAAFYDASALREHALTKLQSDLNTGRKILNLEPDSLAVSVVDASPDVASAILKVKFLADVTITDAEKVFSKNDLLGRTPEEVHNYFSGFPGVASVEIKFSPFWVNSVPTNPSHISLQVKQ